MRTLVVGCGYVGLPLALRAQDAGQEIGAWVRSEARGEQLRPHGFARVITGSVADEKIWREAGAWDRVVLCASSGRGGTEAYREVFVEGARLAHAQVPEARQVFVSSTSVYGQIAGEIVDEESAAEPATETGKILREAEEIARTGGARVVRSAGIYGPGRAMAWEKFLRGDAVLENGGVRWLNQIHRDDLVTAIECVLDRGEPGGIYNAADDTPVTQRDFYAWCAEFSGQPLPPEGAADPHRKRGLTSKRVSNRRLRALGWQPGFPSFREGIKSFASSRSS